MTAFEKFQRFLIVLLIGVGCFYGGYYYGKSGYLIELRKNPPKVTFINQYPANQKVDFAPFWKVWDLVSNSYLDRPVDTQKMLNGAIQGMVASLGDPYTSFLPPKVNAAVSDALNGNYQGIGAELGTRDGQLIVVTPIDGSPAKEAGVKPGDVILEINGDSATGLSVTEAVSKIRGEAGTKVTLNLQQKNQAPRKIEITRGNITLPSISWIDKGDGIAYIRLSRFGGETNKEWDKIVSEVNVGMTQMDAIVLDLRDNPGGYMQSAVHIAEEFFTGKDVVTEQEGTGEETVFKASRVGAFTRVPTVYVLVNEGSASASEILAMALRDNIGAKIVGVKSFGKGTVQTAQDFDDGSGIHITIAKWLGPKKEWVGNGASNRIGITPDVIIERTDQDIVDGKDPQLDKALELIKKL